MKIKSTRTIPRTLLSIAILASCAIGAEKVTHPDEEVIQMRKFEVDPVNGLVTLRWSSQMGSTYTIEETTNPNLGWQESVRDISGDPLETTVSLRLQHLNYGAKTMLYRVRKIEDGRSEVNNLPSGSAEETSSIETMNDGDRITDAEQKLRAKSGSFTSFDGSAPYKESKAMTSAPDSVTPPVPVPLIWATQHADPISLILSQR